MSELLFEHDDRIFPDLSGSFRIFPVIYSTNLVASSNTRDCPTLLPTLTHDWTRIAKYSHIIALLGKIKGEHHKRCHLLALVPVCQSGVRVAESLERLVASKRRNWFEDGPEIPDEKGEAYSSRAIDDCLHEILEDLFDGKPTLFSQNIGDKE
jgi:hypothetical protein